MRWTRARRQTTDAGADGQAVWSWRSEAGAKLARVQRALRVTVATKRWSPGRARRKPLKPLRREGRMIRHHLWFCRVLPFMHADRGCELAPGLPCALCILRDMFWHSSGELRREMADVCFLGCLKIESGMARTLHPRRPGESQDPYAVMHVWRGAGRWLRTTTKAWGYGSWLSPGRHRLCCFRIVAWAKCERAHHCE